MVILKGANFVEELNSCYKFKVVTNITWNDTNMIINSNSTINVDVDPPMIYKLLGKKTLENVGILAMNIALKNIENSFVDSLYDEYKLYRNDRIFRQNMIENYNINNKIMV